MNINIAEMYLKNGDVKKAMESYRKASLSSSSDKDAFKITSSKLDALKLSNSDATECVKELQVKKTLNLTNHAKCESLIDNTEQIVRAFTLEPEPYWSDKHWKENISRLKEAVIDEKYYTHAKKLLNFHNSFIKCWDGRSRNIRGLKEGSRYLDKLSECEQYIYKINDKRAFIKNKFAKRFKNHIMKNGKSFESDSLNKTKLYQSAISSNQNWISEKISNEKKKRANRKSYYSVGKSGSLFSDDFSSFSFSTGSTFLCIKDGREFSSSRKEYGAYCM